MRDQTHTRTLKAPADSGDTPQATSLTTAEHKIFMERMRVCETKLHHVMLLLGCGAPVGDA